MMRSNIRSRFELPISMTQRSALMACVVLLTGCGGGAGCGSYNTNCIIQSALESITEVGTGALDANVKPAATPAFTFNDPDPFSYVNWGPWASKNLGPSGVIGGLGSAFVGQATALSAMPNSGSATYAGRALANYASGGSVQGTVTLNANFGKSTIDVNIFHADGHTLIYGSSPIWENTYQNFSKDGTRDLHGVFFGPNAQETAGTYSWSSPNYSVTGSYGARRCPPGATVC
jgi:hypothetical protein